jgi:ribosomal protein S6E (S10)
MKYRLEGLTIEAIGTCVRITLGNGKTEVIKQQCPESIEVAILLSQMQGYEPNRAQLQACGRAADDARLNAKAGGNSLKG